MRKVFHGVSVDDLTQEELQHLSTMDGSWVVGFLAIESRFDSDKVRLLIEMGKQKAGELAHITTVKDANVRGSRY